MNMTAPILPTAPDIGALASVETEAALIGALMIPPCNIDRVAEMVKPEHFYEPLFSRIYSAILREHSLGRTVTPVTVGPYMASDEAAKALGGAGYLATLTGNSSVLVGAIGFAEQIVDLAKKRLLVNRLMEIVGQAGDFDVEANELAANAETALAEVMDEGRDEGIELSLGDCALEAMKAIERNDPGIRCGIDELDRAIGSLRPRNLCIIAGRPGMAKTAVALAYAKGAARRGVGSLFASLEMGAEELGERALTDETYDEEAGAGVPYDAIVEQRIGKRDMQLLMEARNALELMPLQIIDTSALRVAALHRLVRRWKRRFAARGQKLGLVVVDYLQLMRPDGKTTGPVEAVTEISKGLKMIAKAENVAVMALSQLNRGVEQREDKRPVLSDLRESGQIEQDADQVCFLYRPAYYLGLKEPPPHDDNRAAWEYEMGHVQHDIHFICAKRRKGGPRTTKGRWYGAFQAVRG